MDRHLFWTVPVTDSFGRLREVRIGARGGRVVLVYPPGEGCTMTTDDADYFSASIKAASQRAEMQK